MHPHGMDPSPRNPVHHCAPSEARSNVPSALTTVRTTQCLQAILGTAAGAWRGPVSNTHARSCCQPPNPSPTLLRRTPAHAASHTLPTQPPTRPTPPLMPLMTTTPPLLTTTCPTPRPHSIPGCLSHARPALVALARTTRQPAPARRAPGSGPRRRRRDAHQRPRPRRHANAHWPRQSTLLG